MLEKSVVVTKNEDSAKENQKHSHAEPFILRRKIRRGSYEIVVHFSLTSCETLTDKIMRLIRNEVRK